MGQLFSFFRKTDNVWGLRTPMKSTMEKSKSKPSIPKKVSKDKVIFNDFELGVFRRTMQEIFVNQEKDLTIKTVQEALTKKFSYDVGMESVEITLSQLCLTLKNTASNRRVLIEHSDIIAARVHFLRQIKKYREEGRTIFYTGETVIKKEDQRLIIVHAGSENGFVQGGSHVFKSESSTGDYHSEMNGEEVRKWVEEKLLPNLPAGSVLIVEKTLCQILPIDKCPTQVTPRAEIQEWLRRANITFEDTMFRAELLYLCNCNRQAPKYILDSLLKDHGHDTLRLPAYHADLNAIDFVWAEVKEFVARQNSVDSMAALLQKAEEALSAITVDFWKKCVSDVKKIEEKYWELDTAVDAEIEVFIGLHSSDEETDTAEEGGEVLSADM